MAEQQSLFRAEEPFEWSDADAARDVADMLKVIRRGEARCYRCESRRDDGHTLALAVPGRAAVVLCLCLRCARDAADEGQPSLKIEVPPEVVAKALARLNPLRPPHATEGEHADG